GKFCDESHSLQVVDGHTALYFLTPGDGGPKDPNHVSQTHDAGKKDTFGLQRVLAAVKSGRADDVKYHVVGFCTLGEIFLGVVDHLVSTEGFHHFHVPAVAHRGHAPPKVLGQLPPGRADAPRNVNSTFVSSWPGRPLDP